MPTSNHFSNAELACSCCGKNEVTREFLNVLEAIRHEAGDKGMAITSAYRCPSWNARVSSTGANGPHTTGLAVDVACSGHRAHQLLKAGLKIGITGIGVKQTGPHSGRFIHFDLIETKGRPWIWGY